MRLTKSLLCGISALTLAVGATFAGEGSTHRWHGTGAEYHEAGGLQSFSDADALGSDRFSEPSNGQMALSSLETTDAAYFAQSEPAMTDPITTANSGEVRDSDVYYIVPMEVVEVQEIWLVPSIDSESPQG
jgi:hypothetical protein